MTHRLLPVCAAALGLLMLFHEMFASGLALYPSDPADPRFNEFLLEHSWLWLRGESGSSLFDLPMGYPRANMLALSEPMLSFGPFYWPFRAFGLASSSSHQLWLVSMAALNFGCFHAFVRRALGFDRLAASASAFLFAFGLPRVAQIGHSQLWPQLYLVLVLWGWYALLASSPSDRERRWGAPMLAVGLVLQAWGSLYNAVFVSFMCLLTGLFAVLHPIWRPRLLRALRRTHPLGIACSALALASLWPLAQAYVAAAASTVPWDAVEARLLQPQPGSLVYVWQWSWFYGWMTTATSLGRMPALHEQALGMGFLTTAVGLTAMARYRRHPVVRLVILLVTALGLPAMMWPGGRTLWWHSYGLLPGIGDLRAISRMGVFLLAPASVALGLCVQRRFESSRPAVWLAVVFLCLVEQGTRVPSFEKERFERSVDRIALSIDQGFDAFYYVGAGRLPRWFNDVDAILAAQRLGIPSVNLYTGRVPRGYQPLQRTVDTSPRMLGRIRQVLDDWIRANGFDPARVQLIDESEMWEQRGPALSAPAAVAPPLERAWSDR